MPTFNDGENLGSVRTKINAAITTVDNLEAQGGNLYAAYETRAEAVAAIAGGLSIPDGGVLSAAGVMYLADDGSTGISDMLGFAPFGDVTPDHFGENLTQGTTDMQSAAQAAVNYLEGIGGGVLLHRSGFGYYYGSTVTVGGSDIQIHAHGARITAAATLGPEAQNAPDGVFNFVGSQAASTTLSADASQGDTTITVLSATGIAAGQAVRLYNATGGVGYVWYTEDGADVFRHFITKITGVSGTTITLADPLPMDFDATTYTCGVLTWDGLHNCGVYGGDWDGGGYDHALANGKGTALAYSMFCQHLTIEPETVSGFSGAALWASYTYGLKFSCSFLEGHRDSFSDAIVEGTNSGFYGIRMDDCKNCVVGGFSANRVRHVVDGTRTYDAVIGDIVATNSHRPPFGSHNGCQNWQHSNLSTRGPNGGILWRGFDCTVDGLFVDAPNDSEPAFYDTVGAAGDLKRSYQLSNFKTNMGRESIRLEADIDSCVIVGGDHNGANESSSYHTINVNSTRLKSFQMHGGVVSGAASRLVDFTTGATERDSVSFIGTEFRDYTTSAVRCEAVTGATTLVVSDAYFDPNGATTHVDAQGTYDNLSRQGWVKSSGHYQPDNEGTWAPILGDASNDATHTTQLAEWRKDGDRVHVSGRVTISSKASVVGSLILKFNNLPFTIKTGSYAGGTVTFASGLTLPAAASVTLRALSGGSEFGLYVWEGTGGPNPMVSTDISDTTTMYFEATFVV